MSYGVKEKQAAKEHVAKIRAETVCVKCGGQPIEWHNEEHATRSNRRIAHLVALGFPVAVIDEEIAKCEALCRSCHMKIDGRTEKLARSHPRKKGMVIVGLKPCICCRQMAKPLRKGLYNCCNHKVRQGRLVLLGNDCADRAEGRIGSWDY